MKRGISIIAAVILLAMTLLTSCSGGPVGFWQIEEITSGDVVMTADDAESLGLSSAGSVKLQKSGSCVVNILAVENEGTWSQSDDGTITISYGTEDLVLTGSIDDEGVLTLADPQGSTYKLRKP